MIGIKAIIKTALNVLKVQSEVGAIYITTSNTSPASIFGGNWSKISGRFLIGASSSRAVNSYNGTTAANTTIVSHSHGMGKDWSNGSGKSSAYTMSANRVLIYRYTGYVGSSGNTKNKNIPPYYVVHIWRRTS